MVLVLAACFLAFISITPSSLFAGKQNDDNNSSSNVTREDVDADKFVGNWKTAKSQMMFGSLDVRDILTESVGDPLRPKTKGAVLTAASRLSFALLKPETATEPARLQGEQIILYINAGTGVIQAGIGKADLREGIGVLIPEGVEFTITSGSDAPLTMYMISERVPKGFTPRQKILVRDEFDNKISTSTRRTPATEWLFSRMDGLAAIGGINIIMFEPKTYVPPHVHLEGSEEIWLALRGDLKFQLGRMSSTLTAGSAYKTPADGRTGHANINPDPTSKKMLWIMSVSDTW